MVKKIAQIFNYRPLTMIGLIAAIHMLAYGIGYAIPTSGFGSTVLFYSINDISDPFYAGVFMFVIGLYSVWAWLKNNEKHISISSGIIAFFWLFAAFSYFISGAIGLGIGIGLVWSLLSGYTAFAYKNRQEIADINSST